MSAFIVTDGPLLINGRPDDATAFDTLSEARAHVGSILDLYRANGAMVEIVDLGSAWKIDTGTIPRLIEIEKTDDIVRLTTDDLVEMGL